MSIAFDGTNDWLSFGNVNPTSTSAFTIIGWFKPTGNTNLSLGSKFVANTTPCYIIQQSNIAASSGQGLRFSVGTGTNAVAIGSKDLTIDAAKWHVFVMRYDGGETGNDARLRMWFDGDEQTSLTYSATVPASTGSSGGLVLGNGRSDAAVTSYNGSLGLWKIYNTALPVGIIQTEMYSFFPYDTSSLQFFFYGEDNGAWADFGPNNYTPAVTGTATIDQAPFLPDFFRQVPRANRRIALTKRHEPIHRGLRVLPPLFHGR